MNAPAKVAIAPAHTLVLYRKALHPDLFQVKARRVVSHVGYELECWLMHGSHMLRFQQRRGCVCEIVTDKEGGLPTNGVLATFPCVGEREFEHEIAEEQVNYITAMQTETLSENLYRATYLEMVALAEETDGLAVQWRDEAGGKNLSMLDIERMSREVHVHSYHLFAATGLVLRTQSIFELKQNRAG